MANKQWEALAREDPEHAAKLIRSLQGKIVVPHQGGQLLVVQSPARFRVLRAGRRFGKTKLAAREMITAAMSKEGSMNWWVANTYKNVRRGYRQILQQLPRQLLAKDPPPSTANELVLNLIGGRTIEFYSGGNPDAMAGEGVDFVVVDEAALIGGDVWQQIIRPTLADTKGRGLIISTPRGRNWFYDMWMRGQDPQWPAYASWHFTMSDNPYIDDEEVEELRTTMPERLFNQEILAEFLDNASSIFNLQKATIVDDIAPPWGHVIMGVDLAKHQDYTVIRASRPDRMPVYHERFQKGISWPEQREKIIDVYNELENWPGVEAVTVGVDTGGPGDVIFDELDLQGLDVEPVSFQKPGMKGKMVRLLGSDLESGQAIILEKQKLEFEQFEYKITPSGNMTYQAPEGKHDDEVAATMIEQWVARYRAPGAAHGRTDAAAIELEEQEAEEDLGPISPDSVHEMMQREDIWHH